MARWSGCVPMLEGPERPSRLFRNFPTLHRLFSHSCRVMLVSLKWISNCTMGLHEWYLRTTLECGRMSVISGSASKFLPQGMTNLSMGVSVFQVKSQFSRSRCIAQSRSFINWALNWIYRSVYSIEPRTNNYPSSSMGTRPAFNWMIADTISVYYPIERSIHFTPRMFSNTILPRVPYRAEISKRLWTLTTDLRIICVSSWEWYSNHQLSPLASLNQPGFKARY